MNGLEYLIAMRYHAIMIGVKYGIKTLAIHSDPKVEILANFIKIPCIDFDEAKAVDLYVEKMKALSTRNILTEVNKKDFSFDIFNKEIKDIL